MLNRMTECVESVRCNFTDEEKRKKGLDLAEAYNSIGDLDEEEAVIKAQMKEKRATAVAKVGTLARELAAGFTMQMVKLRLVYDDPNPNEVSYYRVDNDELVKTRPFTKEERQADLPLADGTVAIEAISAEDSQKNMAEFFEKPADENPPIDAEFTEVEETPAVDTRTDDDPEVIEDADPLGINEAPEPPKEPTHQEVGKARAKLLKM